MGAVRLGAAGFGGAGLGAAGLGASAFTDSSRDSSRWSSWAVPMPCKALSSFRRRSSSRPSAGSASSETEEAYRRTPRALTGAAGRGRTPERIRSAGVGTRDDARVVETEAAALEPASEAAEEPETPASRAVTSADTACSASTAAPESDTPESGRGEAPPRARCAAAAIRARGLDATG